MNDATSLPPTRHKLDVAAFYRMAELGIIGDRSIELINGDLIDMALIGDKHADAVDWLTEEFVVAGRGRAVTSVQNPLRLDQLNQPQPDLTLYRRGAKQGTPRGPADALLVVEVADSSLGYDSTTKCALYASFGIPEYWIIDLVSKRIFVHRQPGPDGYQDVTIPAPGTGLTLVADDAISLDLNLELLFI